MGKIKKIKIAPGISWIEVPEADIHILCGCPADSVKHLIKNGMIKTIEKDGATFESGPNVILLSDTSIQNGQFSNLAEFPVLQMLYKQGMIIPNHPNNKGQKPLLMGTKKQVKAQLSYIYRGNYGLTSVEEIVSAGIEKELAEDMMKVKLKFAFGKIAHSDNFLDTLIIENKKVEIKNNVFIKRSKFNNYIIEYKGETVSISLDLNPGEKFIPSYHLGFYKVHREYFSVIHSGEGDGWDIHRPCMSSIITYDRNMYIIDTGPNILETLNALGISVSSIKGIFHTHCHDDHFSGLTALIQADHKLDYYATPAVRSSVSKKLSALLGRPEDFMNRYFNIVDLERDKWNNVEGMGVKPFYSPHPVETTNFQFRVISENGYKIYSHMADIASFNVLNNMASTKKGDDGPSKELFDKVKENYLAEADVKKIDIGGGMIHGMAKDFLNDKSKKIILSHTNRNLTPEEKEIGERASFGMIDTLIPSNANPMSSYVQKYLRHYFPEELFDELRDIINCPIVDFNAGSILLKQSGPSDYLYLTLTGNVEMIHSKKGLHQMVSAGSLIGEMAALLSEPRKKTYVAQGHVWALKIPAIIYQDFIKKHRLLQHILKRRTNKNILLNLPIFEQMASSYIINTLSQALTRKQIHKNNKIPVGDNPELVVIISGEFGLMSPKGEILETLKKNSICREERILFPKMPISDIRAITDGEYGLISGDQLNEIPAVIWKLFEIYDLRTALQPKLKKSA
ncbi:MAG: cyclic nucleotide-binding domain-containing protein [Bdellovibrionota bacterium]|nr:cyclic nucleotide-binding domain-containing protein [Bdellovibrionota bacterium]